MFSVGDRVWVPSWCQGGEITVSVHFSDRQSRHLVQWYDEFWGTLQWWFDEDELEHEVEDRFFSPA